MVSGGRERKKEGDEERPSVRRSQEENGVPNTLEFAKTYASLSASIVPLSAKTLNLNSSRGMGA